MFRKCRLKLGWGYSLPHVLTRFLAGAGDIPVLEELMIAKKDIINT